MVRALAALEIEYSCILQNFGILLGALTKAKMSISFAQLLREVSTGISQMGLTSMTTLIGLVTRPLLNRTDETR